MNIKYIFRVTKNLNIVKELVDKDEYIYEENNIKRRLIKYTWAVEYIFLTIIWIKYI